MTTDPCPCGYLHAIGGLLGQTASTNLARDPDDPYDPDEDSPFTVINRIELKEASDASGEPSG